MKDFLTPYIDANHDNHDEEDKLVLEILCARCAYVPSLGQALSILSTCF